MQIQPDEVVCGLDDGTLCKVMISDRGFEVVWMKQWAKSRISGMVNVELPREDGSGGGKFLVASCKNGTLGLFDANDGRLISSGQPTKGSVLHICQAPCQGAIACFGWDGTVSIVSITDSVVPRWSVLSSVRNHQGTVYGGLWRGELVTGGRDTQLLVSRQAAVGVIATQEIVSASDFEFVEPSTIAMMAMGQQKLVSLFDVRNGLRADVLKGQQVRGGAANGARLWIVTKRTLRLQHGTEGIDFALPEDFKPLFWSASTGDLCLCADAQGRIVIVDAATRRYVGPSDAGSSVAGAHFDAEQNAWEVLQENGELIHVGIDAKVLGQAQLLNGMHFSEATRVGRCWAAMRTGRDRVVLLDPSGKQVPREVVLSGQSTSNLCADISGSRVIVGLSNGRVQVIDVAAGQVVADISLSPGLEVRAVWQYASGDLTAVLSDGSVRRIADRRPHDD